jgi:hypothetical protein
MGRSGTGGSARYQRRSATCEATVTAPATICGYMSASMSMPVRSAIASIIVARAATQPTPAAAMLIRPDGYVAWAAGPDAPDPAGGLHEALRVWFGTPGSSRPSQS